MFKKSFFEVLALKFDYYFICNLSFNHQETKFLKIFDLQVEIYEDFFVITDIPKIYS